MGAATTRPSTNRLPDREFVQHRIPVHGLIHRRDRVHGPCVTDRPAEGLLEALARVADLEVGLDEQRPDPPVELRGGGLVDRDEDVGGQVVAAERGVVDPGAAAGGAHAEGFGGGGFGGGGLGRRGFRCNGSLGCGGRFRCGGGAARAQRHFEDGRKGQKPCKLFHLLLLLLI